MYVNKDHVAEAIRLFKVSTGLESFGGVMDLKHLKLARLRAFKLRKI